MKMFRVPLPAGCQKITLFTDLVVHLSMPSLRGRWLGNPQEFDWVGNFGMCATMTKGYITAAAFPCPRVGDFNTFNNYFFDQGWRF